MSDLTIQQKLMRIQTTLKAPKGQYNSFGKYNYRSCEDILEALKPILAEIQAIVLLDDEIVQIGDRYYVKATATLADDKTDQTIMSTAYAREDVEKKGMDLAQVTGSVSSYARKYALNGLFCIDDTKDSDVTNQHGKDKPPAPPKQPPTQGTPPTQGAPLLNEAQKKKIFATAKDVGKTKEEMKALMKDRYGADSTNDLTTKQASDLIDFLTKG